MQVLNEVYRSRHLFLEGEAPNRDVLIFIPGGPGLGFEYMVECFKPLAARFTLAFYNPGHTSDFQYVSLKSLTDELASLAENFKGRNLGFVAHSGGSVILLEYFKRFGESPSALISWIVDTKWLDLFHSLNPSAKESQKRLPTSVSAVADPIEIMRLRMLNYLDDYFPGPFREKGREMLGHLRYFPTVAAAVESELRQGLSFRSQFILGKCPLLGIGGAEDKVIYPEYLESMCNERRANVQFRLIRSTGHFGFIEKPGEISSLISEFFSYTFSGAQKA